jgi:hypothetical protein
MIKIHKTQADPLDQMSGLTWYIIGPPKSGKTTNASKWSSDGSKRVLIIDTDKGTDFLEETDTIPTHWLAPPKSFNEEKKIHLTTPPEERGYFYRSGDMKGKPMPVYSVGEIIVDLKSGMLPDVYETIVVDTIDKINQWCEELAKQELGIDDIADAGFGKGWSLAREKCLSIVTALQDHCKAKGMNLILISHSKETQVTDGKVQLSPNLPAGLSKRLTATSDAIGYSTFDKETQKPMLSFESYDERAIGSRIPALHNKVFPFDYKAIMQAAMDNEKKPVVKTVKKKSPKITLNNTKTQEMIDYA